jgi:hypothetical protein
VPVILEDEPLNRRSQQRAIVFRFDEFAYSTGLRGILSIDPLFADRLFFVMPSSDQIRVELFARLPEVALAREQHEPAWAAIQCIARFLMKDLTLLTIVRGEPKNGSVNLGYHASEPYDRVVSAIEERVAVTQLRDLAAAQLQVRQSFEREITVDAILQQLAQSTLAPEKQAAMADYLRGHREFVSALESDDCTDFLLTFLSVSPWAQDGHFRRASACLRHRQGLLRWISQSKLSVLSDTFTPVCEQLIAEGVYSLEQIFDAVLLCDGGPAFCSPWWWLLTQLGDQEQCVRMIHASDKPLHTVAALCTFVSKYAGELTSLTPTVRAICAHDPTWRAYARKQLP